MKELIERSYEAIKGRGLIDEDTRPKEFLDKMEEELLEANDIVFGINNIAPGLDVESYVEECTDLATVCIMQLRHLGIDFEKEFEKVVLKNELRAKESTR